MNELTEKNATKATTDGDDQERGAVLLEYAVVSLLLFALIFSAIELSLAWSDTMVLDQSSRNGARVGAQLTNDSEADREALRASLSNLDSSDLDQIEYIVVYEAAADGSMAGGCLTGSTLTCNHYLPTELADLDDDSKWGCGAGTYDGAWCPTGRDPQIHAPVNIGIYIQAERTWITGFLPGDGIGLSSETVMRLDPLIR